MDIKLNKSNPLLQDNEIVEITKFIDDYFEKHVKALYADLTLFKDDSKLMANLPYEIRYEGVKVANKTITGVEWCLPDDAYDNMLKIYREGNCDDLELKEFLEEKAMKDEKVDRFINKVYNDMMNGGPKLQWLSQEDLRIEMEAKKDS